MYISELDGQDVPMALVIEETDLGQACSEFLRRTGARQFNSMDELEAWMKSRKE